MEISAKAFDELVESSDMPIFVDFWASWCIPCKSIDNILKRIKKEYDGRINIVKVNVDRNPGLEIKYQISGVPTLMIIDKKNIVSRNVGAMSEGQIRKILDDHLGGA